MDGRREKERKRVGGRRGGTERVGTGRKQGVGEEELYTFTYSLTEKNARKGLEIILRKDSVVGYQDISLTRSH